MKKVVVTGGSGFIGSHIVDALVDDGYDVHIVDNLHAGNKENINSKAVFHNVDIRDYDKLVDIFKMQNMYSTRRPCPKFSILWRIR